MNLNASPTKEQLRQLLAPCNDLSGHHLLWADRSGNVRLSLVEELDPVTFQQAHPDMQLRYETFQKGNEYVGPAASNDEEWISQLLESLLQEWAKAKGKSGVAYVELF